MGIFSTYKTSGYRKQRKAEKAQKKADAQLAKDADNPEILGLEYQDVQDQVNQADMDDEARRQEEREKNKEEAMSDVTTETPGISDKHRRALQENANAKINSQVQNYSRNIASQTGRAGIRGGAAMAPQQELAGMGIQGQNQFQRDLLDKDQDVAMQRLASFIASLEGKTADDILRREQIMSWLTSQSDKKKQQAQSNQAGSSYNKL